MTFNDLPKQQRLLIYMFYYEAESGSAITMSKNGNDIIAYGISKNENSLANMLYTLRKKGLVTEVILRNGEVAYRLTFAGQASARHLIDLYGDGIEVPEAEDSLQETKAADADVDLTDLVKAVASMVAQKYGNQPKQNAVATDETDVDSLYEQISELRCTVQAKDKQIANIKNAHSQTCALLDKKTKQVEYYENVISTIEKTFADAAKWCQQIKQNAPC